MYKSGLRTPVAIAEASIPEIAKALFESSAWSGQGTLSSIHGLIFSLLPFFVYLFSMDLIVDNSSGGSSSSSGVTDAQISFSCFWICSVISLQILCCLF